ncbi:hypothetical protein [Pseudorhodoplanes sp.]
MTRDLIIDEAAFAAMAAGAFVVRNAAVIVTLSLLVICGFINV